MNGAIYIRPSVIDKIGLGTHRVIEASAGTGKTFTLEHLIVELLIRGEAKLDQILAVTFTQRATAELRARVRAAIDRALRAAYADDKAIKSAFPGIDLVAPLEAALFSFERAPIHTIHSFCQRVLTELAFDTGARFGTEAADGRALFHEAFRAVLREKRIASAEYSEPLEKWIKDSGKPVDDLEKMLFEVNSNHYDPENGATAASIESRLANLFLPPMREWLSAEKFRRGVIDYDDMLERVHQALEDDTDGRLAAALRARYCFALIDEFQDTDQIQWAIFRKIFVDGDTQSALYLIGDPKQAIYSFRGADVHAYMRARDKIAAPPNDPIALTENFRSTAPMIAAVNAILDQNANPPLFNSTIKYQNPVFCGREDLCAKAGGKELTPITLITAKHDAKYKAAALRRMLACRIAATIKAIVNDPDSAITVTDGAKSGPAVTYGDIFILTNTNAEGIKLAEYLRAEGVPYAFYKREGLFQTDEARDVLDMLRAVAAPNNRSHRLKAWATPFFAIPMRELAKLDEPAPSDPLMARLAKWHGLAKEGDLAELFDSLLEESGLAARQLFGAPNLRELTNYEHLFELILTESLREGWSIAEIIDRLGAYVGEYRLPSGEDPNLMRLESERAAVQIMTIHKAKGLEARVVFLFGGFFANNSPRPVKIYHDQESVRRLAIGSAAQLMERGPIKQDEAEEDQRLLYVAITRARAKLYLPYFPTRPGKLDLSGRYKQLNDRLRAMDAAGQLAAPLFETVALEMEPREISANANPISGWRPPASLLADPSAVKLESELATLAHRCAALSTVSYTSLNRRAVPELDLSEYKEPIAEAPGTASEPAGGAAAGIFLHETIEKLDLKALAVARDLASWSALDEVRELFDSALRRHQVPERERWMIRGPELVFNTLRSPIAAGATNIPALAGCESSREMEFTFPIPEAGHGLLASARANDAARWRIERGVYVGFVDFVFRHEDRVYFADWKSDLLDSYEPDSVAQHARNNYSLQAKIYTIGVTRLLGIHTEAEYEAGFGGLLYLFIRGITPRGGGNRGVYFYRPPWAEVVRAEGELMRPFRNGGQPMKPLYSLLGMDTATQRSARAERAATQFETDMARLRASVAELNLDPGTVHLAAEIAALEPAFELDDSARFALIVLIVLSLAAVAEGNTRFPVSGDESKQPLERMLSALMAPPFDDFTRERVEQKIAEILAADSAPAVIGRSPDSRRPLLYLKPYLYHERIYRAEQRLAERLAALVDIDGEPNMPAIAKSLADVVARPAMIAGTAAVLSDEQRRAVGIGASSRLAIISGGPGTGKTSIIAAILRVLVRVGIDPAAVALAAPTGKAAYRMSESIRSTIGSIENPAPEDSTLAAAIPAASTIHRLLGFSSTRRSFIHHRGNPLDASVVIVDEASMLDLTLMDHLTGALRPQARLVIVGDADQLPSVAAGAVLRDLMPAAEPAASAAMAGVSATLSKNYRARAEDTGGAAIAMAARQINEGRADLISAADSPVVRRATAAEIAFSGVELVTGASESLPEFLSLFARKQIESDEYAAMAQENYTFEDGAFSAEDAATIARMLAHLARARILCVTRIGRCGADAINARMHRAAPGRSIPPERGAMIAGEPVIVMRNDYDHMLFNGDQGVLVNLAERGGRRSLAAVFTRETGLAAFRIEMLSDAIDLCYAMTVHKAQGSEFDCVALILPERDMPLLSRETIYTAVSRSRRSCVIFGDKDLLEQAVARRSERFSGLAQAIERYRAGNTGG